jgi:cobalt-zinc-cadmium efflux system protein
MDERRASGPAGAPRSGAFAASIALNLLYLIGEIACGVAFNSVALVADAVHNLSDVFGIALAWWTESLGRRSPTPARTYGFRKSTVLAALANALLIYAAVGGIMLEAAGRLLSPKPANGLVVLAVAGIGVAVNAVSALLFAGHVRRRGDLNARAVFAHLLADAAVSLGVAASGVAILLTGRTWIDPCASIAVSAVIAAGTWSLLRRALDLALDAVPPHVDPAAVRDWLGGLPGVCSVHDLHIWAMSTTETALTAHLVVRATGSPLPAPGAIARELEKRFGIGHATLQIETADAGSPCAQDGGTGV